MITKEKIKKTIDSMPDNLNTEEVIERIILLDKIEQGKKDVEQKKLYTTDEARKRLNKWLFLPSITVRCL
ncbi:MAG: hypothetical protein K9J27_03435 [Bacteroidales bacterium]|nr:hypothetical protein [Bacteroidales bacterium]MCF8332828.1 hypothetical protein [Bacteroidales bacterium]